MKASPVIYSTAGKPLSAPDVYCTSHHCKVKKGELHALMRQGPEAEIVTFSIQDFCLSPPGQTWNNDINACCLKQPQPKQPI